MPPNYNGEAITLSLYFPRWYLTRYNWRVLYYIHDLKSTLSHVKDYEQLRSLDFFAEDIKIVGLDKLDNLLHNDSRDFSRTRGKRSFHKKRDFSKKDDKIK